MHSPKQFVFKTYKSCVNTRFQDKDAAASPVSSRERLRNHDAPASVMQYLRKIDFQYTNEVLLSGVGAVLHGISSPIERADTEKFDVEPKQLHEANADAGERHGV